MEFHAGSRNIVETCTTNERNMLSRFDSVYSYLENHIQRTDHIFRSWSQDFQALNERYSTLVGSALPQSFARLTENISSTNQRVSEYYSKLYRDFSDFASRTQKNFQNIDEKFSAVQKVLEDTGNNISEFRQVLSTLPEAYVSRDTYNILWEHTQRLSQRLDRLETAQANTQKSVQDLESESTLRRNELNSLKTTSQVLERELSSQRTENFSKNLGNIIGGTPGADLSPIKNSVRTIVDRLQFLDSQMILLQNKFSEIDQLKLQVTPLGALNVPDILANFSHISSLKEKLARLDSFDPKEFKNIKIRLDRMGEDILALGNIFEEQENYEETLKLINLRIDELHFSISGIFGNNYQIPPRK